MCKSQILQYTEIAESDSDASAQHWQGTHTMNLNFSEMDLLLNLFMSNTITTLMAVETKMLVVVISGVIVTVRKVDSFSLWM